MTHNCLSAITGTRMLSINLSQLSLQTVFKALFIFDHLSQIILIWL